MPAHNGTGKFFDMVQDTLNGEKDSSERVIGSGDRLTIETTGDFARQIREGLAEADSVVIEFADEVELDITALQLFCSACKTAAAMNKSFIHRGPLPQSLPSLAAAAGSERFEQCTSSNMSCFRQFGGMK
jgi:hypothetical protein